jgi:hypothetical protein
MTDPKEPTPIPPSPSPAPPRTPRFLTPPPPSTLQNSPELRKILFLGLGLVGLIVVSLAYLQTRPSEPAPAPAESAAPAETPEERLQRVVTLFGGALTRLTDGADFEQSGAYLDIVSGVSRYEPRYVHDRATKWLDWSASLSEPGRLRGDFVKVRGLVGRISTVKLRQPAGDVEDVYRFFLSEPDGSEPTVVDLVARPDETPQLNRDVVDLEGVFVRTVAFESEKSGKLHEVPYVVALNMSIRRSVPSGPHGAAAWWFLGGAVVIGLVVARMLARSNVAKGGRHHFEVPQKSGVGIRELFEMRLREDAAARGRPPLGPDPKSGKSP